MKRNILNTKYFKTKDLRGTQHSAQGGRLSYIRCLCIYTITRVDIYGSHLPQVVYTFLVVIADLKHLIFYILYSNWLYTSTMCSSSSILHINSWRTCREGGLSGLVVNKISSDDWPKSRAMSRVYAKGQASDECRQPPRTGSCRRRERVAKTEEVELSHYGRLYTASHTLVGGLSTRGPNQAPNQQNTAEWYQENNIPLWWIYRRKQGICAV